jgi:hypothetical protein
VFKNGVLRRMFVLKSDEITGGWGKLLQLHNSYSFPSTIRMIKSRKIGWAGHVARMVRGGRGGGEPIYVTGGKAGRKEITRKTNIIIILRWILGWTGLVWLKIRRGGGLL